VSGIAAGASLRWKFLPLGWLEAEGFGRREWFQDGSNNNRGGEGTVRLGWQPRPAWELSVGGTRQQRHYEHRELYNPYGRPISGTRLTVTEDQGEARCEHTWPGMGGEWKSVTRLGLLRYYDHGSGYFDYRQRHVSQRLTWTGKGWECELEARLRRLRWDLQTGGIGIDPPARRKDETRLELRVERTLTPRWKIFAQASVERSRCNEEVASYLAHSGQLGLRWTWE
jgi:hypothetical protein